MTKINSMSIVSQGAVLADDVEIGPFCTIGPNVVIGSGTKILGHCNITGHTTIGKNNLIFNFVSMGTWPQDHGFKGLVSYLRVGDDNIFREGFTANIGTKEGSETVIGSHCYFMSNTHVAHNCKVGNGVIMVTASGLAGYTELGDKCLISGLSGTHQFVKVGRLAMISGGSVTSVNIPPFVIAEGRNGAVKTLNLVGLKRNGFSVEVIAELKKMFKIFFKSNLNVSNAIKRIRGEVKLIPEVQEFIDFVETSKRAVAHGREIGRRL